jgi:hypothetical protein
MFLTYHCTLFEVPGSSGSFAITIKPNVIETFYMVDVYLFYITKGKCVMLIHSEHYLLSEQTVIMLQNHYHSNIRVSMFN